jgi:D-serine deaminase-like pyridoxal phosphate-dependent protein
MLSGAAVCACLIRLAATNDYPKTGESAVHFSELDTPALVVDLDRLSNNIQTLQRACDGLGIALRVHTKTHKTPEIARLQVAAGAIGIVSQKLGEAEAMAAAGMDDILIVYNIVGKAKLERLTRLVKSTTTLTLTADSVTTVEGISRQAVADGCRLRMLVEMDTGSRRCGVQSPQETLELAQLIDQLPGLDFMGVMTYGHGDQVGPFIEEVVALTQKSGLPLHTISGGGTGSESFCKEIGCTETRIGSYAYEGMTRVNKRADLNPDRCPLRMIVTVVSTAVPGQIIIDAGMKAFASYPPIPYGYCIEYPEIEIKTMSVEHGHVDVTASTHEFKVGEVLSFIPLHGGMTTNLHDRIYPMRDGEVTDPWVVAGRGKAQ